MGIILPVKGGVSHPTLERGEGRKHGEILYFVPGIDAEAIVSCQTDSWAFLHGSPTLQDRLFSKLEDMSSQNDAAAQALPDRTQNPAEDKAPEGEISKSAAKKAAKAAKLAEEKAAKALNKGIGKSEAKQSSSKSSKKKIDGAALIGIDVSKDEDFPSWYQQVLTKGEMLDYYDVSGCFILKVGLSHEVETYSPELKNY